MTAEARDEPVVRRATPADGAAIAAIYNHYIEHTIVTFEEVPVTGEEMARRIEEILAVPLPWLVAEQGGVVVGYAYAGKWKTRHGYRFTVESTVYLDPNHVGHGTGSRLYRALLDALRLQGVHSAIGGIGLPNEPSVRLHERLGFEKVAHFHENGIKFGRWIDVGYWQLVF